MKRDLIEEHDVILSRIENEETGETLKASMSILDATNTVTTGEVEPNHLNPISTNRKELKSKTLFDSIRVLLLLMNKTGRILNENSQVKYVVIWLKHPYIVRIMLFIQVSTTNASVKLAELMSMKKFKLDSVFDSLNGSIMLIVDHFLYLNNLLLTYQKDQKLHQQEEAMIIKRKAIAGLFQDQTEQDNNFITLKESNRVFKQFHSLTSTLMILVTSIKNL